MDRISITLTLPAELVKRAQSAGLLTDEHIEELLSSELDDNPPPGSLAELAKSAREAGLASPHPVDTAERSREILQNEYATHLKNRMDDTDTSG